jgi:hypothetical protein
LFDLTVITVLAVGFLWFVDRAGEKTGEFIAFVAIGASLAFFAATQLLAVHVDHWLLWNFLIYIPLAWLLDKRRDLTWHPLAVAFLVSIALEVVVVLAQSALLPTTVGPSRALLATSQYARMCVPLGAAALMVGIRSIPVAKLMCQLGAYSLGIYVLHDGIGYFTRKAVPAFQVVVGPATLHIGIAATLLAILATAALVLVLSKTRLQAVIR